MQKRFFLSRRERAILHAKVCRKEGLSGQKSPIKSIFFSTKKKKISFWSHSPGFLSVTLGNKDAKAEFF
jgi:hypothetical protein